MGLFVCDKCSAIENTTFGAFWYRNNDCYSDKSLKGLALCSECAPETFKDGSSTGFNGEWHGRFKKEIATEEIIIKSGLRNFNHLGKFEYLRK